MRKLGENENDKSLRTNSLFCKAKAFVYSTDVKVTRYIKVINP